MGTKAQKEREENKYSKIINEWLDLALASRKGLEKPEVYERIAREQKITEATPKRPLESIVVTRREDVAKKAGISPVMQKRGIEQAVDLGQRLDIAILAVEEKGMTEKEAARKLLDIKGWVLG